MALERALDGATEHFDSAGEEGSDAVGIGQAKKTLRTQDFGGTHGAVGVGKSEEVGTTRVIPSAQDGAAFSSIARGEERIQKNRPAAGFSLLHSVDQCCQALALMGSRAVIRDQNGKPLWQAALQGIEKGFETRGVVVMRNDEMGFQGARKNIYNLRTQMIRPQETLDCRLCDSTKEEAG